MKIIEKELFIEIIADDGMVITQEYVEDEKDRFFTSIMCINPSEDIKQFTEWSEKDYQEYIKKNNEDIEE